MWTERLTAEGRKAIAEREKTGKVLEEIRKLMPRYCNGEYSTVTLDDAILAKVKEPCTSLAPLGKSFKNIGLGDGSLTEVIVESDFVRIPSCTSIKITKKGSNWIEFPFNQKDLSASQPRVVINGTHYDTSLFLSKSQSQPVLISLLEVVRDNLEARRDDWRAELARKEEAYIQALIEIDRKKYEDLERFVRILGYNGRESITFGLPIETEGGITKIKLLTTLSLAGNLGTIISENFDDSIGISQDYKTPNVWGEKGQIQTFFPESNLEIILQNVQVDKLDQVREDHFARYISGSFLASEQNFRFNVKRGSFEATIIGPQTSL